MKAICFCRVSTSAQDLTAQREAVLSKMHSDGFENDDIIIVEGKESAIKKDELERATLNELKSVVESNKDVTDIYFYAIDRLARKVSVVLSIVDKMTAKGINLHFLNPYPMQTMRDGKEDSMGKMFLTFLSIGAEMEMKMKNERFATVRAQMKDAGKIINGSVYFGYYRDKNGFPQVNEEEAHIVRRIMSEYASGGKTLYQIGREIVAEGVWPLKKRATLTMKVRNIILNPMYSEGEGHYQPIADRAIQLAAIRQLQSSKKSFKIETKHNYISKSILYYDDNGTERPMGANYARKCYRYDERVHSMDGEGKAHTIAIESVDKIAFDAAKTIHSLWTRDEIYRKPQELDAQIASLMELKMPLEADILKLKDDRSKAIKKAILHGLDDDDIAIIAREFDEQITAFNSELSKIQTQIELAQQTLAAINSGRYDASINYNYLDEHGRKKLVHDTILRLVARKTDKWELTITVEPKLDFKIGIVLPTYIYNGAGGKQLIIKRVGSHTEELFRSKKAIVISAHAKEVSRKVKCFKDGVLIATYQSAHEAARQLSIDQGGISLVARGKRKTYKGYHFEYA